MTDFKNVDAANSIPTWSALAALGQGGDSIYFANTLNNPGEGQSSVQTLWDNEDANFYWHHDDVVGIWLVSNGSLSANGLANTSANNNNNAVAHQGWVKRNVYSGPAAALNIIAGGNTYSNTDTVVVTGTGIGQVNATANITTNGGGTIVSLSNVHLGMFSSQNVTVSFANSTGGASTGTGANVAVVLGQRIGRVFCETLVAFNANTTPANTAYANSANVSAGFVTSYPFPHY